jgi:hypothetical protein
METKTVDYDITRLVEIFSKYDSQIQAFYLAVKELYDQGDLEGVDAMLKVIGGMLISLSQSQERLGWFSERIQGSA